MTQTASAPIEQWVAGALEFGVAERIGNQPIRLLDILADYLPAWPGGIAARHSRGFALRIDAASKDGFELLVHT